MAERLQKLLSRLGVASRRQAETLIEAGRVTVNGRPAQLGDTAAEGDEILLDGNPLPTAPPKRYLMLHKPRAYVTTLSDQKGRKNVSDLVGGCGDRVYPVGRLDLDPEGLLLLTNDGALAEKLMHPRGGVVKRYRVLVTGFQPGMEAELAAPIEIDGRLTRPAQVRVLGVKGEQTELEFCLRDGRNRQIRRLCQRSGLQVRRLRRVQEGPLKLGTLPPGRWRDLTREELRALERELGWNFLQDE